MSRDSMISQLQRLDCKLASYNRAPLNSNKNNNNRNRGGIAGNKSLALHRCCSFPTVKLGKVEFSRLRFNPLAVVTEQTSLPPGKEPEYARKERSRANRVETRLSRWNSNLLGRGACIFARGEKETSPRRVDGTHCPTGESGKERKTGQRIASLSPLRR